jgi:hypothetical protein
MLKIWKKFSLSVGWAMPSTAVKSKVKSQKYYGMGFFTTHYSLLITHYSLLITYYLLLITHYSLPITHYPLPITHYSLLIKFGSYFQARKKIKIVVESDSPAWLYYPKLSNYKRCLHHRHYLSP